MQEIIKTAPENEGALRGSMTQQRRNRIAELVRDRGAVRVAELSEIFGTSEVTIRSDLAELEKSGDVVRDRGGAMAPARERQAGALLAVEQRAHLQTDAKRSIGQIAAGLVSPGDTILMDAGTTVVEMARHLAGIPSLTVVTNALNVAIEMSAATDAHIILLGGNLSRESSSLLGPLAEQTLSELVVQKLFLGTQAIDIDDGLTDTTLEIAQIKRAMIRAARQVILLADASKWSSSGFIKVAPVTAVDTIVTDEALDAASRNAVEALGIRVLVG